MTNLFDKEEILALEEDTRIFNWKELDGKDVRVIVTEDSGCQVVGLWCDKTDQVFIVSVKNLEEEK